MGLQEVDVAPEIVGGRLTHLWLAAPSSLFNTPRVLYFSLDAAGHRYQSNLISAVPDPFPSTAFCKQDVNFGGELCRVTSSRYSRVCA